MNCYNMTSPSGSLRAVGKSIIPGKPKLLIVVFESLSGILFDERKNERAEIFAKFWKFKNDVWFHQGIHKNFTRHNG